MDYLIDTAVRDTKSFSLEDTARYVNEYWFSNFYKIKYSPSENIFYFIKVEKNINVSGKGSNEEFIRGMWNLIQNCEVNDDGLVKRLSMTPKYIDGKIVNIPSPPKNFLLNVSNSCAMDSLLSIMFFARGGYFMSRIQDSTLKNFPSWIGDQEILQRSARRIKERLFDLYNRTDWTNENILSLQTDLSSFIEDGCDDIKSVNEIWGAFCTLFDGLPFNILTKRQKEIGNSPVETYSIPMYEDIYPQNLFKKPYHLVYMNDVNVDPTDFTKPYSNLDGYELVGIVYHLDYHYVSSFSVHGKWYSYNDLNGKIVSADNDILKQTKQKRIVMLFYTKK